MKRGKFSQIEDQPHFRIFAKYAVTSLLVFVFVHSCFPHDRRVHLGFKPFEVDWNLSLEMLWISVKKWKHIAWFALFYPLIRALFRRNQGRNSLVIILLVSFLIEIQQAFVAGRESRLFDVVPNLLGATLGVWVWSELKKRLP